MVLVKELWMELDAVESTTLLLHRLDRASLVRSSRTKSVWQLFHFITVVVPDSDLRRQIFEQPLARVLNRQESSLTLSAVVAFPRFESSHQSNFRAISDRDLLMATTNTEDRLACLLDD